MPIYLIRHAQSEGNAAAIFQGRQDHALTPLGEEQARALGRWLKQLGISADAVLSSPLTRALQTAQIVATAAGLPPPELEPLLQEYSGGELEGLNGEQIDQRWPDYKLRPLDARGDFSRFGGESYAEVQERLARFIAGFHARFTAEHSVLVVAHGGSLYQLLKLWCTWPTPRHLFNHIGNCCCFKLQFREVAEHVGAELHWMVPLELMGTLALNGSNAAMEARVQVG